MKKILYISDYTLDRYNSVRDILYNLITLDDMNQYEQIIVKSNGKMHNPINKSYYENFKTYSAGTSESLRSLKNKDMSFGEKAKLIFYRFFYYIATFLGLNNQFKSIDNLAYIKTIIKREKPQLVVFLTYSPSYIFAKYCVKHNIPYVSYLYDTYIGRPNINREYALKTEKYVIDNSQGYYVPDFFFNLYAETYSSDKIFNIGLPLLISQNDVINAYNNSEDKFNFTYFGQIQSFRNGNAVKKILTDLNITLDIFSTEKYESDETFRAHPAVTKDDLYNIVAGSKFLVAIDNSFPYQDYLPSKAYLYVSFTKPVIVFGDNEKSALKEFFKDYPFFYYQKIDAATDGLADFLSQEFADSFSYECYRNYSQYLPETALKPLVETVDRILK